MPLRREVSMDIVGCKELAKADFIGSSDPYVIATFLGEEIFRTAVIKDSCDPVWSSERFSFVLPNNLTGAKLVLEVFDSDSVGSGAFLGMVGVNASSLLEAPPPLEIGE